MTASTPRTARRRALVALRGLALVALALPATGCAPRPDGSGSGDSGSGDSGAAAGGPPEAAAPRPGASLAGRAEGWNLWIVSLDTVRADRLGSYGYALRETTPRIDVLVDAGVRFDRAMAPRAATWPSLGSVMTGLYPTSHGLVDNGYLYDDGLPTLATILDGEGYQTGAFLSNMCRANHQGFDQIACTRNIDKRIEREVARWFEKVDRDRPFLLWTHYFAAHSPYNAGAYLADEHLDPGYEGPVQPGKGALQRIMSQQIPLGERDLFHLNALYDGSLIQVDRAVGRLATALQDDGRLERTIIVVLADHGEDLYQHHGYLFHGCSVYQSSLHVPLSILAAGIIDPNLSVPGVVELLDVLPTLLELMGLEGPEGVQGRSLLAEIEAAGLGVPAPSPGRPAYSEFGTTRARTVRDGEWTLIVNPDLVRPQCVPDGPEDFYPIEARELYDLALDPGEQVNLAAGRPEKVAELEALIERRFAGLGGAREQELPEEVKEDLRALGYVVD